MQPMLVTRDTDGSLKDIINKTNQLIDSSTYYLVFNPNQSGGNFVGNSEGCFKLKRDND